jgi:hypothetical protein
MLTWAPTETRHAREYPVRTVRGGLRSGACPSVSYAVDKEAMSHDVAMERGKAIATKYGFPTLYWQKDP